MCHMRVGEVEGVEGDGEKGGGDEGGKRKGGAEKQAWIWLVAMATVPILCARRLWPRSDRCSSHPLIQPLTPAAKHARLTVAGRESEREGKERDDFGLW